MTERSDRELVEAARDGDTGALDELLRRHQSRIFRFGMRMCRHTEDAKDVLQDTMLAVARNVSGFRGDASLSTWLWSIARSACAKKRRRRGRADDETPPTEIARAVEAMEREPDTARGPEEEADARRIEHAIEEAVESLAPMYREVLMLRDVEGLTAPEVAEILGIRVQAVKSRLHRARVTVRERLAPLVAPGAAVGEPAPASCPDIVGVLSRHLEGDLTPSACEEMERHVAACDHCRGACDSLRRTLAVCRTLPAPEVPDEVQEAVREAVRLFVEKHA